MVFGDDYQGLLFKYWSKCNSAKTRRFQIANKLNKIDSINQIKKIILYKKKIELLIEKVNCDEKLKDTTTSNTNLQNYPDGKPDRR